jgi:superfamily II DNA or RNA helicase
MKQLRPYQGTLNQKVNSFLADPLLIRGQVHAPTGAGKTECFIHTINDWVNIVNTMIQLYGAPRKQLRILIAHPRIALSQDQLARFKASFSSDLFTYTSFHSGVHYGTAGETNTCEPGDLVTLMEGTEKHHITFSSYKSLRKLSAIQFDIIICDEAHNLVSDKMEATVASLNGKKILFYTATPIVKDDEEENGMDNPDLFGVVIHQLVPYELIQQRYILPPLVQFIDVETDAMGEVDPIQAIVLAYETQRPLVTKFGLQYHQMLVACSGSPDIRMINERISDIKANLPNVRIITIMADGNDQLISGVHVDGMRTGLDRFEVLDQLRAGQDAIVVHYNTLAEGIDISTLSGAFVMRVLGQVKLIQTIGRPARPYVGDLDADGNPIFRQGMDIASDSRKKRYSVITFMRVNGQLLGEDSAVSVERVADAFVSGGYDDLQTYLDPMVLQGKSLAPPSGEKEETDPTILDNIQDHAHVENWNRLKNAGVIGDWA